MFEKTIKELCSRYGISPNSELISRLLGLYHIQEERIKSLEKEKE